MYYNNAMESFDKKINRAERDRTSLLSHELKFVKLALQKAKEKLSEANRTYGEAVASSGGDWAFDDPGSIQAAREAHIVEKQMEVFRALEHSAEEPYPDLDSDQASIGSRVTMQFEDGETEDFDLITKTFPGYPNENGVSLLSSQSPMGAAIIGSRAGSDVTWVLASGRHVSATLLSVDQLSQRSFYDNLEQENLIEDE
jgi:transcription elongation GreA/GreB family factor